MPSTAATAGSPFAIKLAVDLPIIGLTGALALTTELIKGSLSGPFCGLACDAQTLNALDRTVVGNDSHGARVASDVMMGLNLALPVAFDFLDVLVSKPQDRYAGFGRDTLILAEVATVNLALLSVFKLAVRRPRPYAYDDSQPVDKRLDPDAALSFYSAHSALSFAMATAYSYLFMQRHPGSKAVVPVWILSEALAAVTAYLRVYGGQHFYTDVLTGAVVGSALGILIPYLHRRAIPVPALPALAGLKLSLVPTLYADGGGVLLTAY